MSNRQKRGKTIRLDDTKRQRSSKMNQEAYFNPYSREVDYTVNSNYNNRHYDNDEGNIPYTAVPPPAVRKRELKERSRMTKSQMRRNKKKRKTQFVLRLIAIMTFTIFLVWGGISLKDMLTYPKVSYQVVQAGKLDNSEAFEGIIVRSEKVYYSQGEGSMQTIAAEGEKVKKNGPVCALSDSTEIVKTEQEKDKTSNELYDMADKRKQISYYSDDIYQIDTRVKHAMDTFYSRRLEDTTDYIYAVRSELDNNVTQRTDVFVEEQNNLENAKKTNNTAAQRLTLLENKIGSLKNVSTASESGIISYAVDGQEANLTSKVLDTMNYNFFTKIKEEGMQNQGNNTYVKKGMPLYKIVSDDTWNIVTYCDQKKAEAFKEGSSYNLFFEASGQRQVLFTLKSKKAEEKRVKLIFETNEQIDDFLDQRMIDFSIGDKNSEGLKIPVQAIVEQNMIKIPSEYKVLQGTETGVYRKKGEINEFVKIEPQYEKEGMLYVLQEIGNAGCVQINDVLSQPSTKKTIKLEQLQVAQGVYVINGKLAQFKPIEISMQNGEYALVKYTGSSKLKELDKIISNPKSIKEDQLIEHMNIQNE